LAIVVLVIILFRVFGGGSNEQAFQQYVDSQVEYSLDQCEGEEDEDGCRDGVINDLASEYDSDETCDMHKEDDDRDNCYLLLAMETRNTSHCAEVVDDQRRIFCADGINATLARESNDIEYCDRIMDEDRKQQCADFLEAEEIKNDCINGSEREECDTYRATQTAVEAASIELCEGIEDEIIRESCVDAVASSNLDDVIELGDVDTDNDGLSDQDEETYGTDPNNPDSDADGYTDGDEVSSGYNPLGEGTLE
ncbi:MAG: hypothetical protein P8J32_05050, partial [bacterium]|nr:hypothetical protein [bacterium]